MSPLVLLVVCFVVGIALQRVPSLPRDMPRALNAFIIWVCLPALVLLHVPRLDVTWSLALPIATPWLICLVAIPVFAALGRLFGWSRGTVGALVLTGGLGNTSFVGLPMIEAFHGPEAMGLGLLIDQFGSFIALSFIGMPVAAIAAGGNPDLRAIMRRIVLFPPFVALVLAFVIRGTVPLPGVALEVLERIGGALAPLALVSVGMQLRLGAVRERAGRLGAGLLYKLILAPAMVIAVLALAPGLDDTVRAVTVLEAAMAPMITGSIIAAEHRLDPELAALMVGVGIPLSFLTVFLFV
ncbi:MAG: AEC family transporter [Deltaproteobacteria bacterium]|nr:MAG: AEC family transporter [Deltaproteobacteria bacterium]